MGGVSTCGGVVMCCMIHIPPHPQNLSIDPFATPTTPPPRQFRHLLAITTPRRPLPPHLPRPKNLIAQKQITRDSGAGRNAVAQHAEGVVDAVLDRIHGFAGEEVEADDVAVCLFVLEAGDWVFLGK